MCPCSAALSSSAGIIKPVGMPEQDTAADTVTIRTALGFKSTLIKEHELFTAAESILCGLSVLHSCGLVHRDVRWVEATKSSAYTALTPPVPTVWPCPCSASKCMEHSVFAAGGTTSCAHPAGPGCSLTWRPCVLACEVCRASRMYLLFALG